MELDFWMNKIKNRTQELKSVVQSVPGGATYISLHVVITDQTLSFFTQNTDMPNDWKVTLATDLLCKKDTHIADHSPGANKDTQITDLKIHNYQ